MTVADVAGLITQNLNIALEDLILLCTVLGSFVFSVKDFRIGIIALVILTAGETIMFYNAGVDYVKSLLVFFGSLVALALSLYVSYDRSRRWIV
ncbi:hypothetical protein [Geoglobus ahangari]